MSARKPRLSLVVPGPWRDRASASERLRAAGLTLDGQSLRAPGVDAEVLVEAIPTDPHLPTAFAFGAHGPLPADVRAAIDRCAGALLIDATMHLERDAQQLARLGRNLRAAGGLAVRIEQSGGAFPWDPWIAALEDGAPDALYQCAVVLVVGDDALYTCGMHLFDRPDAEVAIGGGEDRRAAARVLHTLNVYQLAEDPVLASGHTFSPDAQTPRRVLERWPDARHPLDHPYHNPFGRWRLGAPGSSSRSVPELALTITPSLVSRLMAHEREHGALSREQVEALVASSPAIALPRREAMQLERARGYADIDPERAWEHWQIVRALAASGPDA